MKRVLPLLSFFPWLDTVGKGLSSIFPSFPLSSSSSVSRSRSFWIIAFQINSILLIRLIKTRGIKGDSLSSVRDQGKLRLVLYKERKKADNERELVEKGGKRNGKKRYCVKLMWRGTFFSSFRIIISWYLRRICGDGARIGSHNALPLSLCNDVIPLVSIDCDILTQHTTHKSRPVRNDDAFPLRPLNQNLRKKGKTKREEERVQWERIRAAGIRFEGTFLPRRKYSILSEEKNKVVSGEMSVKGSRWLPKDFDPEEEEEEKEHRRDESKWMDEGQLFVPSFPRSKYVFVTTQCNSGLCFFCLLPCFYSTNCSSFCEASHPSTIYVYMVRCSFIN